MVELCAENVDYAYELLDEFHQNSLWYDPAIFCDPVFVSGHVLLLQSREYDMTGFTAVQLMKNILN